jgi:hypothetical protein
VAPSNIRAASPSRPKYRTGGRETNIRNPKCLKVVHKLSAHTCDQMKKFVPFHVQIFKKRTRIYLISHHSNTSLSHCICLCPRGSHFAFLLPGIRGFSPTSLTRVPGCNLRVLRRLHPGKPANVAIHLLLAGGCVASAHVRRSKEFVQFTTTNTATRARPRRQHASSSISTLTNHESATTPPKDIARNSA